VNWQKVKPWLTNLEVLGLAVAIILAGWHSREIHQTVAELRAAEKSLSEKLENSKQLIGSVQTSLSTRSVGTFPDFVDEIAATIKSAKREVVVACDFPGYGEFDRKGLPIKQALESQINAGLKVDLTFLDAARRNQARRAQFPEDRWRAALKAKGMDGQAIIEFMQTHGSSQSAQPDYQEFIALLDSHDQSLLTQTFRRANVIETIEDMPLLFWIADDERAIMVVQSYGGLEDSAFVTSDLRLIRALKSVSARYRQLRKLRSAT
jgi:hypothetical protein